MPTEEAGLGKERMQLAAPDLEFIDTREHHHGHVMAACTIGRAKAPAFPQHAACPVPLDGSRIRTDCDKHDAVEFKGVGGDVDAHAPAAVFPAFLEDPVDLGPDR
jgi:hypothetical protein